ncbi:MAG TPA: hypothetical protein VGC41_01635, partial [Kofleriaceae bacterium]
AGQFRPLKVVASDLPAMLTSLVDRMLSTNPMERPQTGAEVAAALDEISRSYGFNTAKDNVAQFLAALFRDTDTPHAPISLVREVDPAGSDPAGTDFAASGATEFDDYVPNSGSASQSLHGDAVHEQSSSLPRSVSPPPPLFVPQPPPPPSPLIESVRPARTGLAIGAIAILVAIILIAVLAR